MRANGSAGFLPREWANHFGMAVILAVLGGAPDHFRLFPYRATECVRRIRRTLRVRLLVADSACNKAGLFTLCLRHIHQGQRQLIGGGPAP